MFRILVRGRKDKRAVEKALDKFYSGWGISVSSLHGLRGDSLSEELHSSIRPFTIVLSGRRDYSVFRSSFESLDPRPFTALVLVDRSEVRNARIEMISHAIDIGRALLRGAATVKEGVVRLYYDPVHGLDLRYTPEMDNFLVTSEVGGIILSQLMKRELRPPFIFYKLKEGRHEVYDACGNKIGVLHFGHTETSVVEASPDTSTCNAGLEDLLDANRLVLVEMEKYIREFLEKNIEEDTLVIVPWSGGKDSTAMLLAATRLLGKDRVHAVSVDTGVEFPETLEYLEHVSRKLGIEYTLVKAGLDKAILQRGLPRLGERWCTGMKLEALEKGIRSVAGGRRDKIVVLVGDRDAESKLRVKRPPRRIDNGRLLLSPLKLFGGVQIELYLISHGIGLNPLYNYGFYRIGCFICPSLRDWELRVISKSRLGKRLIGNIFFRKLICDRRITGEWFIGCRREVQTDNT